MSRHLKSWTRSTVGGFLTAEAYWAAQARKQAGTVLLGRVTNLSGSGVLFTF